MAGGIAGQGHERRPRRLGRQRDFREHLDEDGVGDAFAHAGDVDDGGLAAAGAGHEGDEAADLGDAGRTVVAFVVHEHLVAVAHLGQQARVAVGGVDDGADVDVEAGLAFRHDDGDRGFFLGAGGEDGHDDQDDAQNGQEDQREGAQGVGGRIGG